LLASTEVKFVEVAGRDRRTDGTPRFLLLPNVRFPVGLDGTAVVVGAQRCPSATPRVIGEAANGDGNAIDEVRKKTLSMHLEFLCMSLALP